MDNEKELKEEIHEEQTNCGCNDNKECTCGDECTCEDCHCEDGECTCGDDCNCGCHDEIKENKKDKKEKKKKSKEEIMQEEINSLNVIIKDLENKVLLEKAELINYRKRKDDEVSYMLKYANEDMVKELLPIVDNFERAIKLDDDNLADELSKFLEGFKMIYCHLVKALEKFGVKAIDGANKPFDPTYHQAVLTEAHDDMESGMVIEVLQKGYLLKDKVIRPAMVKVSE